MASGMLPERWVYTTICIHGHHARSLATYFRVLETMQGKREVRCKMARGCKTRMHVIKHAPNVGYVTDVCGDAKRRVDAKGGCTC